MSSHREVLDELHNRDIEFAICYPAYDLERDWVNRLYGRYQQETNPILRAKDWRAWKNAQSCWESTIASLDSYPAYHMTIESMDYNLALLIEKYSRYLENL